MITCTGKGNPFITYERVAWTTKIGKVVSLEKDGEKSYHYMFHVEEGVIYEL